MKPVLNLPVLTRSVAPHPTRAVTPVEPSRTQIALDLHRRLAAGPSEAEKGYAQTQSPVSQNGSRRLDIYL